MVNRKNLVENRSCLSHFIIQHHMSADSALKIIHPIGNIQTTGLEGEYEREEMATRILELIKDCKTEEEAIAVVEALNL